MSQIERRVSMTFFPRIADPQRASRAHLCARSNTGLSPARAAVPSDPHVSRVHTQRIPHLTERLSALRPQVTEHENRSHTPAAQASVRLRALLDAATPAPPVPQQASGFAHSFRFTRAPRRAPRPSLAAFRECFSEDEWDL